MIYAVEILDSKFIKIGFSSAETSKQRIATLQTGNPFEIKELFTVEGTIKQEQSIHAALSVAFTRIRLPFPPNEWYPGLNPFFQEFLEHLKLGANSAIAFAERYNSNVKQPSPKRGELKPNIRWPSSKAFENKKTSKKSYW
jgi:hypothetical protein